MRLRALTLLSLALAASSDPLMGQQVVQLGNADVPLEWTAPEVYTVGDDESREEEQFARIVATAFDAEDNLYVLDGDNGRVIVFDRTGRFVRQFGRKGEGPGELRFPFTMTITRDGHVVVLDPGNRALVVYDREGEYVRNLPIDRGLGIGGRFLVAHPNGGVVFALNPGVTISNGAPQMDTSGVRVFWQQSFDEGAEPILLYSVKEPGSGDPPRVERRGNATIMTRRAPPAFTPQLHFGLTGEGLVAFNRTADYELHLVGQPGAVTRTLVRPFKARKVTEADKETERERRLEAFRSAPGPTVVIGTRPGGGAGGGPAAAPPGPRRRAGLSGTASQSAGGEPPQPGVRRDHARDSGSLHGSRGPAVGLAVRAGGGQAIGDRRHWSQRSVRGYCQWIGASVVGQRERAGGVQHDERT
jgi:hypothetical protein